GRRFRRRRGVRVMVNFTRWLKHTFIPPWRWRLAFSSNVLLAIEHSITESERQHRGELRFAIENALLPTWVWQGMSGQQRATEIFSTLRVWDTEDNSGVLIYVLLADKEVHIIADRGIAKQVTQAEWNAVAQLMQNQFREGHFRAGALDGINRITTMLATFFPPREQNVNELPNKPVIIRK
ncbi:MAG: TPM domain-containing protein, partial [Methylococcales bacterium]